MHIVAEEMKIVAGRLFDSENLKFVANQVITVSEATGLIHDLRPLSEEPQLDFSSPNVIDLRNQTVLPGFVDTHVHFFLHSYAETSWADQTTQETIVERIVRAVNHAKATLLAGYTTVRDLGTEGAEDADLALRKCISGPNALIPGPRYFVANRAIAPTGSYGPKSNIHVNKEGVEGVCGVEFADGVDECRKAVRRQIGAGADWIKIYADYRFRSRVAGVSKRSGATSMMTFHHDELKVMVDTAHELGVKVAAHATEPHTIKTLISLGIDTIEHGTAMDESCLDVLSNHTKDVFWVPTLSVIYTMRKDGADWVNLKSLFGMALQKESKMSCGGDTGTFPHGENALEMKLMTRLGADWKKVLSWATLGGWESTRSLEWEGKDGIIRYQKVAECNEGREDVGDNEMPFGVLKKGFSADIIATGGDLENDFEGAVSAKNIIFVMRCGKVYKIGGRSIC